MHTEICDVQDLAEKNNIDYIFQVHWKYYKDNISNVET